MSKIMRFAVVIILLYSSASISCALDPITQAARQADWEYNRADYVFLGKIITFDDLQEYKQIVTFVVQKTFKGPEFKSVTIVNMLNSSCSRAFIGKGNSYYVFAKLRADGNYSIENGASFVPVSIANEYEMDLEQAHNKQRNTDSGADAPPPVR